MESVTIYSLGQTFLIPRSFPPNLPLSSITQMADQKVMNRYYPPDFDPSKLLPVKAIRPKRTPGPRQMSIRMMMPFTMRCSSCGEYMYIATKFNSRCEKIHGTTSLGLNAYRFFGSCKHCKAEFIFRTDPEHSDYVLESGGTRNYEAFKDADYAEDQVAREKALEEENSEAVALESKIYDTAEEMRRIEELGELRAINKREARRDKAIDAALDKLTKSIEEENLAAIQAQEAEQYEEEFRALKKQHVAAATTSSSSPPPPPLANPSSISSSTNKLKIGMFGNIKIKSKPKN